MLSMEESELRKKIIDCGHEMREKYCPQVRQSSLMFPPAPRSKFIDKFPEDMKTTREQIEHNQQVQYEGEVKFYRLLENMNVGIVLHGFRITHKMCNLFVRNHSDECKRNDKDEEGECDFLVILDHFLAIFEIKVPDFENCSDPNDTFKRNYKDSKKQRKRMKEFIINGICKRIKVSARELTVLEFTVFIEADNCLVSEFPSYKDLSEGEKKCILFKNCDVQEMEKLLLLNQKSNVDEKLLTTLLGLWYYDVVADRRKSENVELSDTILILDEQLKMSKISRVGPKQRPASSFLVIAPKALRHFGLSFITKDQLSVLENKKRKLWINGPAGSGKTLMILGKIIGVLEKNPQEKVIVVVLNEIVAKYYKQQLEEAGICSVLYDKVNDAIFELETKSRVFIVYFREKVINRKLRIDESYRLQSIIIIVNTGCHIFMDDFHGLTAGIGYNTSKKICRMVYDEFQSSSQRLFWVTYDILQDGFLNQHVRSSFKMREVVENVTDKSSFQSLPAVLRNSYQIANLLSSLRVLRLQTEQDVIDKISKGVNAMLYDKIPSKEEFQKFYCNLSLNQNIGHYIHGPKPRLYTLSTRWSNKTAILKSSRNILTEELMKLRLMPVHIVVSHAFFANQRCSPVSSQYGVQFSTLDNYDSTPYNPDDEIDWKEECENVLEELHCQANIYNDDISVNYFDETFSAEWPAVVGIIEFSRKMFTTDNWISFNDTQVMSNCDSMMDQLLSKIYITASRARVYCCLILITRDFDSYIHEKKAVNSLIIGYDGVTYGSEYLKRAATEACHDFNKLYSTLNNHMSLVGQYICKTENDCKMSLFPPVHVVE